MPKKTSGDKRSWLERWSWDSFHDFRIEQNKILRNYFDSINHNPTTLLDIGCGLAEESFLIKEKYHTELYLLEGDVSATEDRERDIQVGPVEDFKFYNKIEVLQERWDQKGSYTYIDASNINIDKDVIFDTIVSFQACGFHLPLLTYKDLIQKHSNTNTVLIADIQDEAMTQGTEIIDIVYKGDFKRIHYKFVQ